MKRIINFKILFLFLLIPIYCVLFSAYPLYAEDKIVAVVNKDVVTQKDLNDFLHFMTMQLSREFKGKELENKLASIKADLLNRLIEDKLILQEAKKRNVSVSEADINKEIKKLDAQLASKGQKLDQVLSQQNMSQEDLKDTMRVQLTLEKMFAKDVSVSEDEVNKYIEANKSSIPESANQAEVAQAAKDSIRQQKLGEKVSAMLQDLRKKAKITYFVNY